MVTPHLHFIWGFKEGDTFGLIERIAIQSACCHHPTWPATLWTRRIPTGSHWEKLKAAVPWLRTMPAPRIDTFNGRPVPKYQHKADALRYSLLYSLGGVYLDLDTITLAPIPKEWLEKPYTIGLEYHADGSPIGLCNAVYMCAPFSRFGWRVLSEFQAFDPAVHAYAEFGVYRPLKWALEMAHDVHIVKGPLLGPMHWDIAAYWEREEPLRDVVIAHLWKTNHSDPVLRKLTEEDLRHGRFAYAQAAKRYV
jgi:hypothetical protein